jgi:hypothetical protein
MLPLCVFEVRWVDAAAVSYLTALFTIMSLSKRRPRDMTHLDIRRYFPVLSLSKPHLSAAAVAALREEEGEEHT